MFNILSQITLKVKFLRNEEQHCLLPSPRGWLHMCLLKKMQYSFTSFQLYFLVPLSSFLAHLLASHICIFLVKSVKAYINHSPIQKYLTNNSHFICFHCQRHRPTGPVLLLGRCNAQKGVGGLQSFLLFSLCRLSHHLVRYISTPVLKDRRWKN